MQSLIESSKIKSNKNTVRQQIKKENDKSWSVNSIIMVVVLAIQFVLKSLWCSFDPPKSLIGGIILLIYAVLMGYILYNMLIGLIMVNNKIKSEVKSKKSADAVSLKNIQKMKSLRLRICFASFLGLVVTLLEIKLVQKMIKS